jgi:hypothetical protein
VSPFAIAAASVISSRATCSPRSFSLAFGVDLCIEGAPICARVDLSRVQQTPREPSQKPPQERRLEKQTTQGRTSAHLIQPFVALERTSLDVHRIFSFSEEIALSELPSEGRGGSHNRNPAKMDDSSLEALHQKLSAGKNKRGNRGGLGKGQLMYGAGDKDQFRNPKMPFIQ